MGMWLFAGFRVPFLAGDYTAFVYPYSGLLFLLAMDIFPRKIQNRLAGFIRLVSQSTYHIFLFQIFYFSVVYFFWPSLSADGFGQDVGLYFVYFGLNLLISFAGGVSWFKLEQCLKRRLSRDDSVPMLFSQGI